QKQLEQQPEVRPESRELTPVPVPVPAQAPVTPTSRHSSGNYRGTQTVPMAETSIPRVQESAKHPSAYQNEGFERDNARQRNAYF
uniref:ZM domain-containing protein n=1 Tax=Macrostomum lignano TaxID=282301 RepID=A0A1I8GZ85_9PLAT